MTVLYLNCGTRFFAAALLACVLSAQKPAAAALRRSRRKRTNRSRPRSTRSIRCRPRKRSWPETTISRNPTTARRRRRYLEATRWDPGSAEAFRKLGEAREKLHEYGPAREAYLKYIELAEDPKESDAVQKKMAKWPRHGSKPRPQYQEMTDKIVVFSACDSEEQAGQIARALVEQRLAACVNIVPGARSIYRWKGQIEDAAEWLLIIKSRRDLMDALRAAIGKIHSYEVPELLAVPVVDGSESYLAWLDRELG